MGKDQKNIMKRGKMTIIISELFSALSGALVLFIALEIIKPLAVLSYFNLNYLVLLWLVVSGYKLFSKWK